MRCRLSSKNAWHVQSSQFYYCAPRLLERFQDLIVCMCAGIMARMVVQQPQSVMVVNTTYSNQWTSGICDCCEDVAGCESVYINVSIYTVMMFVCFKGPALSRPVWQVQDYTLNSHTRHMKDTRPEKTTSAI